MCGTSVLEHLCCVRHLLCIKHWVTYFKNNLGSALAIVAQVVGASSHNLLVAGSISGQGTCLGCGFHPQCRHIWEGSQLTLLSHINCFSLSLRRSLKSMKKQMSSGEDKKTKTIQSGVHLENSLAVP